MVLCLEDICAINVFFRLETYPVQMLGRLPHAFRHKLYSCLSPADVLHYGLKSNVFDDIEDNEHQLQRANDEKLIDILFGENSNPVEFLLPRSVLSLLKCDSNIQCREYIDKCYESLKFVPSSSFIPHVCSEALTSWLLPQRALRYLDLPYNFWNMYCGESSYFYFTHDSLGQLLEYCNAPTAPREIKLDLDNFTEGILWLEFDNLWKTHTRKVFNSGDIDLKMDPTLLCMQEYFSTAEIVRVGSSIGSVTNHVLVSTKLISFVVLYNIVTCKHPRPKHIEVYGHPDVVAEILTSVEKLCSDDQSPVCFSLPKTVFKVNIACPPAASCIMKGLSVLPSLRTFSLPKISELVMSIVSFQLHNLERVVIEILDHYESHSQYCALLSVLTELLRQPQLQFMSVSVSPLHEACSMIEAFLCTETTHHQTLRVVGRRVQRSDDDDAPSCKKIKIDSTLPLPVSNGTFKTLDIGISSRHLHDWLFSIPNLQLKELRTSEIKLVPENVGFPVTENLNLYLN